MLSCNALLAIALTTVFCAAPPSTAPSSPAAAPQAAKAEALTVKIWSCADHQQFRMTEKGACPVCAKDLVAKEIAVSGPQSAGDPYPLDTCPVSGMTLGKTAVGMLHEGRELRFCGKDCVPKFQAEPAKYLTAVDEKIVNAQLKSYPLTTCPVSGESLDAMGGAVNQVYNNRLVRFCCKMCVRKFKQTPAEFLAKLDEAVIAKEKAKYPLATCMVSGQKLGGMGEPVNYVVAGHLVEFCCPACIAGFYKAPADYLAKLDKAWGGKGTAAPQPKDSKGG